MHAYYKGIITKDKALLINDENNELIKEGQIINKDINYIFYSSLKLNGNHYFTEIDSSGNQ